MLSRADTRIECLKLAIASGATSVAEAIAGAKAIERFLDSTDDIEAFKEKLTQARKDGFAVALDGRVVGPDILRPDVPK